MSILDAMHYLASAWSAVTAITVKTVLGSVLVCALVVKQKLLNYVRLQSATEMNSAMETVGTNRIAYSDYASVDDTVVTSAVLSIDGIMAECADACSSDDKVEGEQLPEQPPEPNFSLAVVALDLLRRYVLSDDAKSHVALQVLEKHLVLLIREEMHQATLHSFKRKQ